MTADDKWQHTFASLVLEPAVAFVVRTGEIILLAGAFRIAAQASDNPALHVLSGAMFFALAVHFGLAWGRYVLFPLGKLKVKSTGRNLAIVIVAGLALGLVQLFLWEQIAAVAKELAPSLEH